MNEKKIDTAFIGHQPRECGEHRTVGSHRAWCYDCSEWCYPRIEGACKGCRIPALTSERDEAVRVAAELRALAEKMAPHIIAFRTATDVIHAGGIGRHSIAKADQCSICYLRAEVDATLDALAHGGTKPQGEPMNQKEHGS